MSDPMRGIAFLLLATVTLAACDEEGHVVFRHFVDVTHDRPAPPEFRQQVADCFYDAANDQMSGEGYSAFLAYLAEIAKRDDMKNLHNLPIAKQVKYVAYGQIAMDLYLGCRSQIVPQKAMSDFCRGKQSCS